MTKTLIPETGGNPFSDIQARSYSDKRVVEEFCPIPQFWDLFNGQHEVILGTRGCGKTILLKMMRYSMLKKMTHPAAARLVKEKEYIAFYVPLHLEFIKKLETYDITEKEKVLWFRFAFNCALAQSIIIELNELINDLSGSLEERYNKEYVITEKIQALWNIAPEKKIHQLTELRYQVVQLFYSSNPGGTESQSVPQPFIHSFASSLSSINEYLRDELKISPTWLICVDEAEFLDECYQKCINTAFRSDTERIIIKLATLPFYHRTKCTLDDNISVMNGQDFKYTIIDMKPDSPEFAEVTDSIVKTRFSRESIQINSLSDFVETIGSDCYLDYYRREFGEDGATPERIQSAIIDQLPSKRKHSTFGKNNSELKKPIFNKYAPIFYLREVKKRKKGRHIPGWYAGTTMIRRLSQGNPRIFIRIMDVLYTESKGKSLPLKIATQHKVLMNFADSFCEETKTLEGDGPRAKEVLDYIANYIQNRTHGQTLALTGQTFQLSLRTNLMDESSWIKKAVAFSRLRVDANSMMTELTLSSIYDLSNLYSAKYWIPLRGNDPIRIKIDSSVKDDCGRSEKGNYEQLKFNLDGDDT